MLASNNNLLSPSLVISIRYPLYKHFAIVSDRSIDGKPNLISLSYRAGAVLEEPWDTVVGKYPIELSSIRGGDSAEVVLKRARNYLNSEINYNLLTFNCEHFVRLVHGLPAESRQVQRALYGAIIGTATCLLLPKITLARFALLASAGAITSLKSSLHKI